MVLERRGFGAQRVRFPIKLLHQEVQSPATGRALPPSAVSIASKVGAQPIHLLFDVGTLQHIDDFLLQPFRVGLQIQSGQSAQ